ncbi:S9 family peptidase isoform X1 [Erpetoichthys calabaricus]|uniref:S9 family peptidase isoform X1 n=1 Tax=Erpetoichthys calabaricus TaxID=27687 RepID=UPI0022347D87|nr:S9 family peptidase isoform X1 [Erpetoichthys calabaricus]
MVSAAPVKEVTTDPKTISAIYRQYCSFPSPTQAFVGPEVPCEQGGSYINICTEWTQSELERGQSISFSRQHTVLHDGVSLRLIGPPSPCTDIQNQLLSCYSPSGKLKAVIREKQEKQFLEIWGENGLQRSTDLSAQNVHGKVYGSGQFGVLSWSHSEKKVLYVAEKKRTEIRSFFQPSASVCHDEKRESKRQEGKEEQEDSNISQQPIKDSNLEFWDDWGEGMSGSRLPVLCILDIQSSCILVVKGIPDDVSPGQALWAPGDQGLLFVGWHHEPFRLGLKFCYNRRSALYHVDFEGRCELLSSDSHAISSPRLSPDQRHVIYLEGETFGPHSQCLRLQLYDWLTKETSILVDRVKRPEKDSFAGLYTTALPMMCWSADSQRILVHTPQRSKKEIYVVQLMEKRLTRLVDSTESGSWTILTAQRDLVIAFCSAPNSPPSLKLGIFPPKGGEQSITWVSLQESDQLPAIEWTVLTFTPPPAEENQHFPGLDFEALLVKPKSVEKAGIPLIVQPHGGPHSVFVAQWQQNLAVLVRVGFAVLQVNYRGSTGFGQDSIESLIGLIGRQDVKDVQHAVNTVLQSDATLNPKSVYLLGGSHGGFLVCHLVGQYPDFYKAGVMMNPVINYATLLGTSDITDWRYTAVGLQYSYDRIPTVDDLAAMLTSSPLVHAAKITTPVLLLLGGKDKRVTPKQGVELYRVLKSRSRSVRLLWYPDDGHSLSKTSTMADSFMAMILWFLQHLGRKPH